MERDYLKGLIRNFTQLIKVETTEVEFAYKQTERISAAMELFSEKALFEHIKEFIYCIYPSFYLNGFKLKDRWLIINDKGKMEEELDNKNHVPTTYVFTHLSMFIQRCRENFNWQLSFEDSSAIINYCQRDFSKEYLKKFPYVTRVFTQNDFKREQYSNIGQPVEFAYFSFQEVQGSLEEIVRDKMIQLKVPIETEVIVVDDEGLELDALSGMPGPYVKEFVEKVGIEGISRITEKMQDTGAVVRIAIGMKYRSLGTTKMLVLEAGFPVEWMTVWKPLNIGGYYSCLRYRDFNLLHYRNMPEAPRTVLFFWLWHKFRRRKSQHLG